MILKVNFASGTNFQRYLVKLTEHDNLQDGHTQDEISSCVRGELLSRSFGRPIYRCVSKPARYSTDTKSRGQRHAQDHDGKCHVFERGLERGLKKLGHALYCQYF
jgi:hypothetical protein